MKEKKLRVEYWPCIRSSWLEEQLFISNLQLCQCPRGSAAPGAKMFLIWIKAVQFLEDQGKTLYLMLFKGYSKNNNN